MRRATWWLLAASGFSMLGWGLEALIGEHPVLFVPLACALTTGAVGVHYWCDAAGWGEPW